MTNRVSLFLILGAVISALAQAQPPISSPLKRRYQEGDRLTYQMKGVNEKWKYEIQATGVVKRNSAGKYFEEYAWSNLISDGAVLNLPAASVQFRQALSLDPDTPPSLPNLSTVHPTLIGPITDMLTFYADLWLAMRDGHLTHAGDHVYRKHGKPASWADGNYVVVGEDSIDFDITLTKVDDKSATLLIRHVPPEQPQVRLSTAWMREPVADTPNNWVQVSKKRGGFVAAVGKETFDVRVEVSLVDGRILAGSIDNNVDAQERDCADGPLASCGEPRPRRIVRKVEIAWELQN